MLPWIALLIAVLAVVVAWTARRAPSRASGTPTAADDAARARVDALREEVERELALQRRLLAKVASGVKLSPEAIAEGRLWDDVDVATAKAALERGEWRALDVRTPQETARGIIAGATCIPVDELERRTGELDKGARWLVYCASGGRSAAACEFLSNEGFEDVHNLETGIAGWPQSALERR